MTMTSVRRTKIASPASFAVASLLALFGSSSFAQTEQTGELQFANGIAAIAEDKVITVDDIRREISHMVPQLRQEARSAEEFNQKIEALQDDIIQQLIDRVLIVKEFYKDEKRRIPASYVDNQIADTQIQQFDGDRSKFLGYLKSKGKTNREYRKEVEEDIIYGYMRQQQRKSQSAVSPVKIETYYNENKERFFQEDEVHVRMIQFSKIGRTEPELMTLAKSARDRVLAGEKFEDVAREVSQDSKKSKGGDWGWYKKADLKAEFSDPVFAVKKGEVTEPVLTSDGVFLLYAEDRKFAGIQPIDEVRDQIEHILTTQTSRQANERWLERLRRNGYVKHY